MGSAPLPPNRAVVIPRALTLPEITPPDTTSLNTNHMHSLSIRTTSANDSLFFPVADQIARQVEDPGLKHSSQTHVGLELSIRHAAEFFAFFVCRFILADLGLLMDKFVKRGTEWALA